MLAIVNIAGKQFKTSTDQELIVPRLGIEIGKKVDSTMSYFTLMKRVASLANLN